ncbi:2-hydroxyacid dehydrogenase [Natrialba aegyptia]|uniref:Phosphoglycerate dehydrogenase n=1 Tax=Natrialba aegyptia DSM 13077 TaxID=1227491 RepID=M0AJ79_9EURY|nr:2-hydroxyacid dehydrogenase [Natrialba aegyptia]ELY98564.1 phosphoglycerate dehydrogenase [Natrialba aegyptia DSM 13077]
MKALVTANFDDANLNRLRDELGMEVDYRPIEERSKRLSSSELEDLLEGVDVFVVGYEGVSAELMNAAEDLQLIACARGGPDANVDIAAATEHGIPVLYAPGRNAVSVADFTFGLILAVVRNIARSHHLLHTGTYTGEPVADAADSGERDDVTWGIANGSPYVELSGPELQGKTLGIVGLGAIGRNVAQRADGFEMELLGFDPFVDAEEMTEHGIEKSELDDLCERSDIVTVHCPVTDATRGLIGEAEFDLLSQDAYFVNTARGAIVDQDALIEALRNDELAGAALDVYDQEPLPDDHPLLELPNVITTPHLAGAADEVVDRHSAILTDDIAAVLAGREPDHVANEAALAGLTVDNDG